MGETETVRGRRRSGALTRGEIIEAAVEISTAEGPAGVSFRVLGGRLGVAATALYRHFRDNRGRHAEVPRRRHPPQRRRRPLREHGPRRATTAPLPALAVTTDERSCSPLRSNSTSTRRRPAGLICIPGLRDSSPPRTRGGAGFRHDLSDVPGLLARARRAGPGDPWAGSGSASVRPVTGSSGRRRAGRALSPTRCCWSMPATGGRERVNAPG
ncbi:TetR/AcrR family transcriptional regulator [Streptomyces sp. NPDC101234]|uniref:TetR/AcrR family transcriptional regulator n=1 Tax=Streptomyces sp. NPDC101234 TaxID=3366138 RepID=UPI00380316DE